MKKSIHFKNLKSKIQKNKVNIGIIGLGYVGLPLALSFAKKKINVLGIDIDKNKINLLEKNKSYVSSIASKDIKTCKSFFKLSYNLRDVKKCNVIILCLPTPLTKNMDPDMSFIISTINYIINYLKKGSLICLESTTYPGTTEEIIIKKINSKFKIGYDFFVAYSPEREDPGNEKFKLENITKIVSGFSENCKDLCKNIYSKITNVHVVSSLRMAETVKLFENIFRSVNIGLVNEMKLICDKMNLNIHELIDAAKTKPFGYMEFRPGPGLGGHCIPIDPFLLTWKAKEFGINTKFIELSGQINDEMPNYVCGKVFEYFRKIKIKKKPNILIIGIAYKKNTNDIREAPSLKIIEQLKNSKFNIFYYDPYFKSFPKTRKYNLKIKKYNLYNKKLKNIDLCLLITDHDNIDYKYISDNSKYIIDTRGKFKKSKKITYA